jgi:hypothetical protein
MYDSPNCVSGPAMTRGVKAPPFGVGAAVEARKERRT